LYAAFFASQLKLEFVCLQAKLASNVVAPTQQLIYATTSMGEQLQVAHESRKFLEGNSIPLSEFQEFLRNLSQWTNRKRMGLIKKSEISVI
jgi:hypothetical protein